MFIAAAGRHGEPFGHDFKFGSIVLRIDVLVIRSSAGSIFGRFSSLDGGSNERKILVQESAAVQGRTQQARSTTQAGLTPRQSVTRRYRQRIDGHHCRPGSKRWKIVLALSIRCRGLARGGYHANVCNASFTTVINTIAVGVFEDSTDHHLRQRKCAHRHNDTHLHGNRTDALA